MGVAVTIAGGGDGLFFSIFSELLSKKKTGQGNEATECVLPKGNWESCTRPISTNPESMEASEHGLTRWTCFVARRLEVVAVPGCCGYRGVSWAGRIS